MTLPSIQSQRRISGLSLHVAGLSLRLLHQGHQSANLTATKLLSLHPVVIVRHATTTLLLPFSQVPSLHALRTANIGPAGTNNQQRLRAKLVLAHPTRPSAVYRTDALPSSLPQTKRLKKFAKKHLRNPLLPQGVRGCIATKVLPYPLLKSLSTGTA